MKNKATSDLNQAPPTLLAATDFYDLKLPFPKLDEEQLRDRSLGNLASSFKLMLCGRTNPALRAAAAELGRVIEPVRNVKRLTTRFRALLYALVSTDLTSIKGFPGATEDELIAVLGLLLLQEYLQTPKIHTSGQKSPDSLTEMEAQIFEAWACSFSMSKMKRRLSTQYEGDYGVNAPAKYRSEYLHQKNAAIKKNSPYRDLEREVIKRYRAGQEVNGKLKNGKWKSASEAGRLIYEEMKMENDALAKKPGGKAPHFLPDNAAAGVDPVARIIFYIRGYIQKKRASEDLANLGIPSTWNPDENAFVPYPGRS